MTHEVIFDSKNCPMGEMVNLASGYISLNEIKFVNENVTVSIEAKTGDVVFYDTAEKKSFSAKVEIPSSGDEKITEVKCVVEGAYIKLGFPKYTYKDNYPHCDGEHDRWTKTVSSFSYLCYDYKNNCLIK